MLPHRLVVGALVAHAVREVGVLGERVPAALGPSGQPHHGALLLRLRLELLEFVEVAERLLASAPAQPPRPSLRRRRRRRLDDDTARCVREPPPGLPALVARRAQALPRLPPALLVATHRQHQRVRQEELLDLLPVDQPVVPGLLLLRLLLAQHPRDGRGHLALAPHDDADVAGNKKRTTVRT